jgi:type 1 glutamine amidotransferase
MKPFDLALDENFGAEITDPRTVPLYETLGHADKRQDYGGWCTEKNKGRVVGLLAGHTYFAFRNPNYLRLFRRAAYWALRKDIPAGA